MKFFGNSSRMAAGVPMRLAERFRKFFEYFNTVSGVVFDTIFPKRCFGCGQSETFLCVSCSTRLYESCTGGICPLCNKKISGAFGTLCRICKQDTSVDGLLWGIEYAQPLAQKVIKAIKYDGIRELIEPLAKLVYQRYAEIPFRKRPTTLSDNPHSVRLVPVPLHRRKQYGRGFNQAELAARHLSALSSWDVDVTTLRRVKATASQTNLSRRERLYNIQGAFQVKGRVEKSYTYVLVDDVATTGATLGAAARELKRNGARIVWAATLAKG